MIVAASLLIAAAVPAYAAPVSTEATPSPAPSTKPSTPTKTTKKSTKKSTTKKSSAPARTPADTNSELGGAGVDDKTKSFRDKLAAKQAELDAFTLQLEELDRELALAAESYNQATDRLDATRKRVEVAEDDLGKAKKAYSLQQDVLATRARSIYQNGTLAWAEVLLGSDSIGELVQRVKFLNTIGVRDAEIAQSLRGQKGLVEQQVAALQSAESEAEALEFELRARKIEVMLRITERQEMMASVQSDLLKMLDSEAARRAAEEQKLFKDILAGANAKGIEVIPGTPVETALAYHGIPYLWGGESPSGMDCSGLMLYVFKQHGVTLPHYSGSQFLLGKKVAYNDLEPGDAVFFGSPIHHVGMYIGGGYFIHAPRTGDFIKISVLSDRGDFAGARRYDWKPRTAPIMGAKKSTAEALKEVPAN
ncbi:MAG: C40 family peptidase [Coriobacteriales bacterium]|nr:C40 family peptidase [Coriobacteriales bacterium]